MNFIDVKTTLAKTSKSKSALYEALADPRSGFPRPVKLGRKTVFVESEINAWVADQIAARDAALSVRGTK